MQDGVGRFLKRLTLLLRLNYKNGMIVCHISNIFDRKNTNSSLEEGL